MSSPTAPDQPTIDRWHRWFAVELNNRGWDLAEQPLRNESEEREMLAAAYGAECHWSKVGSIENTIRAAALVAHAHSTLGHGELALANARRMLDLCVAHGIEDWDLASAHIELARAAAVAGDCALHAEHHELATRAIHAIRDVEDRRIMAKLLHTVPSPA